jgi:cytochrome c553
MAQPGRSACALCRQADRRVQGRDAHQSDHGRYRRRDHAGGRGDLGAYFSSLKITVGAADPALVHAGERIYRGGNRAKGLSACIACHGPDGRGNQPGGIPALGGQHAQYTAAQLKAYAAGERRSDPNQIMRNIAALMSPEEIAAVASYVQGLH